MEAIRLEPVSCAPLVVVRMSILRWLGFILFRQLNQ